MISEIDPNIGLKWLQTMMLIRAFEEKCIVHYTAGLIRGFLHLYIGQEAIATGICHQLDDDDVIFATYREHGHALARGLSPDRLMAEMFGKMDGVSGGRGGSMHLFDADRHFLGGNAIVASALPMAVGYALGLKKQSKKGVVVCFFGEGAVAEGAFHEAMNLAVLWQAPVLFVCENNLYAMGTSLERSESQTNLCVKAQSYLMRASTVDGMDIMKVAEKSRMILNEIRTLREPYFLECKTYRYRAHSMFDPDLYRDPEEIVLWKKRDPIALWRKTLQSQGILDDHQYDEIKASCDGLVEIAGNFAQKSPDPPLSSLTDFVLSDSP